MRVPKGGVAFFDSGIGGLTVMAACRRLLPDVPFYYYGDNRHAPYGNLPKRKIKRYVFRAFRRFARWKVSAAVLACNTATAACIEELRSLFPFPIIGTEPAVYTAAKEGGEVWVLSTRATYESERFRNLCARAKIRFPKANLTAYPCDGLAGAIEKNLGKKGVDFSGFLPRGKPQTVVLGCTHYPYIKEEIEGAYGCKTVDGNEGVARRLKGVLEAQKSTKKTLENTQNHSRPPSGSFSPSKGGFRTMRLRDEGKKLLRQNINKRSLFYKNKGAEPQEIKGKGEIFFFGRSKKRNEIIYKQMFV